MKKDGQGGQVGIDWGVIEAKGDIEGGHGRYLNGHTIFGQGFNIGLEFLFLFS